MCGSETSSIVAPARLERVDGLADPRLDARLHALHEVLGRQAEALALEPAPPPRRPRPGGCSSSSGTGTGADVESRSSRPATACRRIAASRESRASGPIWSSDDANATIP